MGRESITQKPQRETTECGFVSHLPRHRYIALLFYLLYIRHIFTKTGANMIHPIP